MTADEWARLKGWFEQALDAPERRDALLLEAERESPALAAELRALLAAHDAPALHDDAVLALLPSTLEAVHDQGPLGGVIGPYRVIAELGRGGSGVVFRAERLDDEFHRPVALKVLRYVAWDARTRELLTEERRALARLQHPHIAALLDWSSPASPTAWLAMEFVDGVPIDVYCREHRRDTDRLLDIFEQVCEAVQFAHQQLIVHRDLKPGNILVTADGSAKLLDFGISKHLEDTTITQAADRRFTPAYASPEQLTNGAITVATDVYALGLILYELLAGEGPHAGDTLEDLMRRTQDVALRAPSVVAARAHAPLPRVPEDLDRIVLHALEQDPARRYPSVERLLADIRRFRSGFPIEAQRASRWYRAQKFLQRNTLVVAWAAVAVLALVGGTSIAVWQAAEARAQARLADERFADVRSLAHWVIFEGHDAIRRIPGTVAMRRALLDKAVEYLDRLNAQRTRDDSLAREMAQAYIRVGYSEGGLTGTNLGNTVASRRAYRAALGLLDDLWRAHPTDEPIGTARFAAAYNLSMMLDDPREGVALAARYAAEAKAWSERTPTAASLMATELTQMALGRTLRAGGRLAEALVALDAALAADSALLPLSRDDKTPRPMFGTSVERSQNRFDTGLAWFARGEVLLQMGRVDDAIAATLRSRDLFAEAAAIGLGGPSDDRMHARVHGLLAQALLDSRDKARLPAAREASAQELRTARRNVSDGNATSQRDLGEAERHAGLIALADGDANGAIAHLLDGQRQLAALRESDPAFALNTVLWSAITNDLGLALSAGGDAARAREQWRTVATVIPTGVAENPDLAIERVRAERRLGGAN